MRLGGISNVGQEKLPLSIELDIAVSRLCSKDLIPLHVWQFRLDKAPLIYYRATMRS